MGESKRRKEQLGDQYGQDTPILRGLPITKAQSQKFVEITTRGAWIGIGVMVATWITIRFIGPGLGWWTVSG